MHLAKVALANFPLKLPSQALLPKTRAVQCSLPTPASQRRRWRSMRPMGSSCRCWMVPWAAAGRQPQSQAAAAARLLWWAPVGACAHTHLEAAAHGRLARLALCAALPSETRSLPGHSLQAGRHGQPVMLLLHLAMVGIVTPGPCKLMNMHSRALRGPRRYSAMRMLRKALLMQEALSGKLC